MGDDRTNDKIKAKKALCVLFYFLGKCSFRMFANIFEIYPFLVYKWITEAADNLPQSQINDNITEISFDEM